MLASDMPMQITLLLARSQSQRAVYDVRSCPPA
jgi:hypothetical protein